MKQNRGITLVEMLLVVAIIGLMASISFPAVSSGVDSLRLSAASDNVVSFLNSALNRAERRQEAMEVTIAPKERTLTLRSADPAFIRTLELPQGVRIEAVLPELPNTDEKEQPARRIYLYPGGSVPRIGVRLVNARGARRVVRVDPITGVPQVERQ